MDTVRLSWAYLHSTGVTFMVLYLVNKLMYSLSPCNLYSNEEKTRKVLVRNRKERGDELISK